MEGACGCIASNQTPDMSKPFIPPAFAIDIAVGAFTAQSGDITEGFSMFCMRPSNSPSRNMLRRQGQAYTISGLGQGSIMQDGLQMILENDEVELPESMEEMRGFIEGYFCLCVAFLGLHNRAVIEYRDEVVARRNTMLWQIEADYVDLESRRTAWVTIMAFITCVMNNYLTQLEMHEPPMVLGTWRLVLHACLLPTIRSMRG